MGTPHRLTHETGRTGQPTLLVGLGALVVLALGIESLPLGVEAQFLPLASVLALAALPVALASGRCRVDTPLAKLVLLFALYLIGHSIIALAVDILVHRQDAVRAVSWLRQVVALVLGVSVFFVLRASLQATSTPTFARLVLFGALPALLVAFANVVWNFLGSVAAEAVVLSVRETLLPYGYNHPTRVSGLSVEPASFAYYLSVAVLPMAAALWLGRARSRRLGLLFLLLGTFAILMTFSATGLAALAAVAAAFLWGVRRIVRGSTLATIASAGIASCLLLLTFIPGSYLAFQIEDVSRSLGGDDEAPGLSPSNTFYSTVGPFMTVGSSFVALGYGLGGTATHFESIVPPEAWEDLLSVSWEAYPNLRTLLGRVFAEGGIVALALWVALGWVAFRQVVELRRRGPSRFDSVLLFAAWAALFGTFVALSIKIGSFASPFMWLWLAFIDARFRSAGTALRGTSPIHLRHNRGASSERFRAFALGSAGAVEKSKRSRTSSGLDPSASFMDSP